MLSKTSLLNHAVLFFIGVNHQHYNIKTQYAILLRYCSAFSCSHPVGQIQHSTRRVNSSQNGLYRAGAISLPILLLRCVANDRQAGHSPQISTSRNLSPPSTPNTSPPSSPTAAAKPNILPPSSPTVAANYTRTIRINHKIARRYHRMNLINSATLSQGKQKVRSKPSASSGRTDAGKKRSSRL